MKHTPYKYFIGIDVGKLEFVSNQHGTSDIRTYPNHAKGWESFIKDHSSILKEALVVLETTGGYEFNLLAKLCTKNYSVHRADTRKVKSYIRACKGPAKTDALDAKALAEYGCKRCDELGVFVLEGKIQRKLKLLVERRADLVQLNVQEKNREQAPLAKEIAHTFKTVRKAIETQIKKVEAEMAELIASNPEYTTKKKIMMSVPGVGDKVANTLLAGLPELGVLTRRQIASLAGVAPHPQDSGTIRGYRSTKVGGRRNLRPILYLAAMAASRSASPLREFYLRLVAKGKAKKVALTALMRKIVTILNAKLRLMSQNAACLEG